MPRRLSLLAAALAVVPLLTPPPADAQDLSSVEVKRAIERGRDALVKEQGANGKWSSGLGDRPGITALALLALLESGMEVGDPPVDAGLRHLRDLREDQLKATYDASLAVMAFAAAKDGRRDSARMLQLVRRIEDGRVKAGNNRGGWGYELWGLGDGADRSNSQYAVLALREAVYAGIPVKQETWEDVAVYWVGGDDRRGGRVRAQNADGGWGYGTGGGGGSRGSMTVAGIATVSILKAMLREDRLNADGAPDCCGDDPTEERLEASLKAGTDWLTRRFAVTRNPSHNQWVLYYLYGLERAGRLAGERFFGEHDWYREGAAFLVRDQDRRTGEWRGNGHGENDPVIGTSFALLFLAKGLSPVLINKLDYDTPRGDPDAWRKHPSDARNLTFHVSGLPKWPKLVTWQVLDLDKAVAANDLAGALQGPVTLMTGDRAPDLSPAETKFLRDYVDAGGFLLGVANCDSDDFAAGFRKLVAEMYPDDSPKLERLGADHPVFRSEYLLDADTVQLFGADLGCRTPIVLSEVDLSCYWDLWMPVDPPSRDPQLVGQITQKVQVGVNILAYATGREPPDKLERSERVAEAGARDEIERGLLQVAKLRHEGEWDAAPRALRNLLLAVNTTAGVAASTAERSLVPSNPNVFRYPVLYMHGRGAFTLGEAERARLRTYFENGGVLFADACCGSDPFDRAFREQIAGVLPDAPLVRLPADHELFSEAIGFDLSTVRRRVPGAGGAAGGLDAEVVVGEPFLEAAVVNGQVAVIYSKYDISCALERQTTVACAGYVPEDALKIGINVLRYALLRDPVPLTE